MTMAAEFARPGSRNHQSPAPPAASSTLKKRCTSSTWAWTPATPTSLPEACRGKPVSNRRYATWISSCGSPWRRLGWIVGRAFCGRLPGAARIIDGPGAHTNGGSIDRRIFRTMFRSPWQKNPRLVEELLLRELVRPLRPIRFIVIAPQIASSAAPNQPPAVGGWSSERATAHRAFLTLTTFVPASLSWRQRRSLPKMKTTSTSDR